MDHKPIPTFSGTLEKRGNNFDFLRFLFASSVILSHSVIIVTNNNLLDPLWHATRGQLQLGKLSVSGFFLLSGLLISRSWEYSKGFRDFLKKRVLRILPGFIVVYLASGLIVGPLGSADHWHPFGYWRDYFYWFNPWPFVAHMLELDIPVLPKTFPHVPEPNLVNPSLWSIRPEFETYLVIALIGTLGFYRKRVLVLVSLVLVYSFYIFQQFHYVTLHGDKKGHWIALPVIGYVDYAPELLSYTLVGAAFYCYHNYIPRSRLIFAACVGILGFFALHGKGFVPAMPIPLGYIIYYIAFSRSINLHNFARRGDLSYGIYLWGWPVEQLLIMYFPHLNVRSHFILSLLIVSGIAWCSWTFVEKPCLALKKTPAPKPMPEPEPVRVEAPRAAVLRKQ